jgi:hypothetical protein
MPLPALATAALHIMLCASADGAAGGSKPNIVMVLQVRL